MHYVLSQFFLFHAMWKVRKAYPPGWLAYLYCVLIYVLTGLDFATVSFSDINLFYILILCVIYQQQIRMANDPTFRFGASPEQSAPLQVA